MIKFFHIGMRKCGSTSLQEFLKQNEKIYFLGKLQNRGEFVTEEIGYMIENGIVSESDLTFEPTAYSVILDKYLSDAIDKGYESFGASDESIIGPAPYANTFERNLTRLSDVWGDDTRIILFIRDQWRFLESQYGIMVRHGYCGSFDEYLQYLLINQHRAVIAHLQYDAVIDMIYKHFQHVLVVPLESFVKSTELRDKLCDYIGISKELTPSKMPYPYKNRSTSARELRARAFINHFIPHLLGNSKFVSCSDIEWSILQRNINKVPVSSTFRKRFDSNYGFRRYMALAVARMIHLVFPPVSYKIAPEIKEHLSRIFRDSNRKLAVKIESNLADLGYDL